jgi:tetratricopeptide (TPR) repeat protein
MDFGEEKIKTAEEWKLEGNTAYHNKNFEKAIHAYEEAIKLNPEEPFYYSNKAASEFNLGKYH